MSVGQQAAGSGQHAPKKSFFCCLLAAACCVLSGCMTAPPPAEGLSVRPLDVTASQVAEETKPPPRPVIQTPRAPGAPLPFRLRVPAELPGAEVPPLVMPSASSERPAFERAL